MTRGPGIFWRIPASTFLLLLVAVWPLSYLRADGIGLGVERWPTSGWRLFTRSWTDFPGYSISLQEGYFFAWKFSPAANPGPPATEEYSTYYGSNASHWHGTRWFGFGTVLNGGMSSTVWQARTGIALRLWPLSLLAALALFPLFKILPRAFKDARAPTLCPTCRYDLRTHPPGARCPECGTPTPNP
jgi:hypothetical protein